MITNIIQKLAVVTASAALSFGVSIITADLAQADTNTYGIHPQMSSETLPSSPIEESSTNTNEVIAEGIYYNLFFFSLYFLYGSLICIWVLSYVRSKSKKPQSAPVQKQPVLLAHRHSETSTL